MSESESMEPPLKRQKSCVEETEGSEDNAKATETEITEQAGDDEGIISMKDDKCKDFVSPEELEKLREFQILDEIKSNDEDSNDEESNSSDGDSEGVPDAEIEKMLEEDLPDDFKGAPKPIEKPFITRQKIVLEEKGVNHFEVLPLDWMMVRHYSGMPVYMHRATRVCTLSKPYFLGKGNTRRHEIPISAIPCLAYRKALIEEQKQAEIDRQIEEQIKNGTWKQDAAKNNKEGSKNNEVVNETDARKSHEASNIFKCPFLSRCKSNTKGPTDNVDKENKESIENSNDLYSNKELIDNIDIENKQSTENYNDESETKTEKLNENKSDDVGTKEDTWDEINKDINLVKEDIINTFFENNPSNEGDEQEYKEEISETKIYSENNDANIEVETSKIDINNDTSTSEINYTNIKVGSSETNINIDKSATVNDANVEIGGNETNTDNDKSNNENNEANVEKTNGTEEIPLNRQPVVLPGGIVMPPPRVETVSTSWKTQHLTHEQVNEYCKKLFKFRTVNIMHFKRWADRRKYTKARKTLQYPTLPEGTKLITIPANAAGQENGGKANKRDWMMNMNGRSYLSVFHEYVRRALQKQPTYEFKQLENASTPYQATVYIGGMQYGAGRGSSKRAAKSAAARASIHILIPEMRSELEPGPAAEPDFSFFDYVGIEDPRITEFCAATCEPSPHAILRTCLLRNFGAQDKHIHTEMKKLEYQKIELTMKVGKHTATVVCKNKKTAKQRASQAILQALHPHVRSWGSLLRLYGSRSVKSSRERKLEEQQITLLQDAARLHQPNHAVLSKLRQEMQRLRERDEAVVPIGTLLVKDDLPTHSGSNLNNVDL